MDSKNEGKGVGATAGYVDATMNKNAAPDADLGGAFASKMKEAMGLLQSQTAEIERLQDVIKSQQADIDKRHADEDKDRAVTSGVASVSKASTKARYAIVIEEGRDSTDAAWVDVGVNGRVYRMQRGKVCEVPPEVIGVLKNAIAGVARPFVDGSGESKGVRYRNSRRFPYRILGKAVDAEGKRIRTFEEESPEFE